MHLPPFLQGGHWTADDLIAQTLDVIDWYEMTNPGKQLILETDWSSGHAKGAPGLPNVQHMAQKWGSANAQYMDIEPSEMTAECLGSERAIMYKHRTNHTYHTQDNIAQRLVAVDCKLKVGQKQSFTFLENDPPPFYAPNTPKYDIKEGAKVTQRGYVGCRKGTKQLSFERGLWRPGMVASMTAKQHAAGKIAELHCEKTVGLPAHTQPPPHASPPKPTHTHTHTHTMWRGTSLTHHAPLPLCTNRC